MFHQHFMYIANYPISTFFAAFIGEM